MNKGLWLERRKTHRFNRRNQSLQLRDKLLGFFAPLPLENLVLLHSGKGYGVREAHTIRPRRPSPTATHDARRLAHLEPPLPCRFTSFPYLLPPRLIPDIHPPPFSSQIAFQKSCIIESVTLHILSRGSRRTDLSMVAASERLEPFLAGPGRASSASASPSAAGGGRLCWHPS